VFVSAHRADKQWARWLQWHLADAGSEVVLQDWGFLPEEDFNARAQGVGNSQLVVVVLSQDYVDNPLAARDWTEALVAQVGDDRLLPVMATPCTPPAALGGQVVHLPGLEELDALKSLRDVLAQRGLTFFQPHPRIHDLRRPRYPALRPKILHLDEGRDAFFTRDRVAFDQLHDALQESCSVVLCGLSGVGKSAIAREYAYVNMSQYDPIWWIEAIEPAGIPDQLLVLAERLGVDVADREHGEALDALWDKLRERHDWLLVYDNAVGREETEPYLPVACEGHVIVTSQSEVWPRHTVRPVQPLQDGEAVTLIQKWTGASDQEAVRELTQRLGGLPIFIIKAASFINETGLSPAEYVEEYLESGDVLPFEQWSVIRSLDSVYMQVPAARDVTSLFAFLDSNNVPRRLFRNALKRRLGGTAGYDKAIASLRRYTIVTTGEDSLSSHDVVLRVVRSQLSEAAQVEFATEALRLLAEAFPREPGDPDSWPDCARLLPHVMSAVNAAIPLAIREPALGDLLQRAGAYVHRLGFLRQAADLYERAVTARELRGNQKDARIAESLSSLGRLEFHREGGLDKAESLLLRSLDILRNAGVDSREQLADTLGHLGRVLREKLDLTAAEQAHRESLELYRELWGDTAPKVAYAWHDLGVVRWRQGRFRAAEQLHTRALEIRRTFPSSPTVQLEIAGSLKHLGIVLRDLGTALREDGRSELEQAERLLREAMTVFKERFADDHPEITDLWAHLADVLRTLDRSEEARRILEPLVASERTWEDREHDLAQVRRKLGEVYRVLGLDAEATEQLTAAYQTYERSYGPDHPYVAEVLLPLGALHCDQGAWEQTESELQRVIQVIGAAWAQDHPYLEDAYIHLGHVSDARGDREEAEACRRRSAEIRVLLAQETETGEP
jgi:tetratricopeptide (TPR) repeat protein